MMNQKKKKMKNKSNDLVNEINNNIMMSQEINNSTKKKFSLINKDICKFLTLFKEKKFIF